jgi:hypothetical protein
MNQTETTVNHFGGLVDYLSTYPDDQLDELAETFDAPEATPVSVARTWCRHPEAYLETVEETLRTETAWSALAELAFEHDAPVETEWIGMSPRYQLAEIGFVNRRLTSTFFDQDVTIPGALAALVAPLLDDTRPSLAMLLGQEDDERIRELAREYELSDGGSRLEVVLRLMDFYSEPDTVDQLLKRIANPDWLGMAMMVLELGGVCYWQEVFGHETDTPADDEEGGDVVPLMGRAERDEEKRISDALLRLGVLFQFDPEDTPYTMVAVPEALWNPLWQVGHGWLIDWVRQSYNGLGGTAQGGANPEHGPDLQQFGKWLVCESSSGELTLDRVDGTVDEESLEHLTDVAGADPNNLESRIDSLIDLSILRQGLDGFVTIGAEYETLLDMDRPEFIRNVLYEWCGGFLGRGFEKHLPKAIGLDDEWREQAIEVLRARHEFIPHWMNFEGVPQERTGAGCLRETADNSPDLLSTELGLANGYVWSMKMVWLDVLSFLESERWYSFDELVATMQYTASVCLFSQVGRLLEDPRSYFYLPVQRTSFLTDPFHTTEFELWLEAAIDDLLVPLQVAETRERDDYVWLETDHLRIDTPPGWAEEERRTLLGQIIGRDHDEIVLPPHNNVALSAVSEPARKEGEAVSLERPIEEILEATRERQIAAFEGDSIVLSG